MSEPTTIVGQPVTMSTLPVTDLPAPDDFLLIDGETNGTRRMTAATVAGLQQRIAALEAALAQVRAISPT
jgi:hypothetical protein